MNNITVSLPTPDPINGKMKKAALTFFQLNSNLEMKLGLKISYYEADGVTPAVAPAQSKLQPFMPIEMQGTTEGNYVDANGDNIAPEYDEENNITNGAMPELEWWQSLLLGNILQGKVDQSIVDNLNSLNITFSDLLYGLIAQTIIRDNKQGLF